MTVYAGVDDCRTAARLSHNCRIQGLAMNASGTLERCMLVVEGLTCRFGTKTAVDNASFSVAPGSFIGVIGRSGAGKSTLLRMINRLARADVGPHPLRRRRCHRAARPRPAAMARALAP